MYMAAGPASPTVKSSKEMIVVSATAHLRSAFAYSCHSRAIGACEYAAPYFLLRSPKSTGVEESDAGCG